MAPEVKPAKNSKLPKLSENCFDPIGKGGWTLISIWINPPSLASNGLHFIPPSDEEMSAEFGPR
jgi:hypothetical protein